MEPPVFGCAALKASSGQMRVLSMFWKGKELDEGLAYFNVKNNLYKPFKGMEFVCWHVNSCDRVKVYSLSHIKQVIKMKLRLFLKPI